MAADLFHLVRFASNIPAEMLVGGLWQGLLLVTAAWLAFKALPRIAPSNRFVLWMFVFLLSALVPLVSFLHIGPVAGTAASSSSGLSLLHLSDSCAVVLVSLWAFASLLSFAQLVLSGYRLRALARSSTPLSEEAIGEDLRLILTKPRSRPVRLRSSGDVECPIAIGFLRPAILIPEWLVNKLTHSELKQIVLHELAHLERRDDWTNLLQKLLRAIFPLNPALIWADRQLSREREMACDDAVLEASVTPREYASCLTSLAEKRMLRRAQSLAPGAWQRRSELAERVHRILKQRCGGNLFGRRPVVAVSLATFLCAGLLARCPQIVTFAPAHQHAVALAEARASVPFLIPASQQAAYPAHLVQASMTVAPSHKIAKRVAARHTASPRHALASRMHPVRALRGSQAPSREVQPTIILSLWQPSLSVSTVTIVDGGVVAQQITTYPSRWIVFEL